MKLKKKNTKHEKMKKNTCGILDSIDNVEQQYRDYFLILDEKDL